MTDFLDSKSPQLFESRKVASPHLTPHPATVLSILTSRHLLGPEIPRFWFPGQPRSWYFPDARGLPAEGLVGRSRLLISHPDPSTVSPPISAAVKPTTASAAPAESVPAIGQGFRVCGNLERGSLSVQSSVPMSDFDLYLQWRGTFS